MAPGDYHRLVVVVAVECPHRFVVFDLEKAVDQTGFPDAGHPQDSDLTVDVRARKLDHWSRKHLDVVAAGTTVVGLMDFVAADIALDTGLAVVGSTVLGREDAQNNLGLALRSHRDSEPDFGRIHSGI